jgi:hypothetical protein
MTPSPSGSKLAATLVVLALAGLPVAAQTAAATAQTVAPTTVTPADDAYHYAEWADGRHDVFYTEWWYFNLHDESAGVDAIFSYFVTDPADIAGVGQVQMVAVAATPEGHVSALDRYPAAAFSADDQAADVSIGGNRARAVGDGTYRITGTSLDGRLGWDLEYAPDSTPWFGADRMPVGRLGWELMSWLVQMPRAHVTGTVTVDGQPHVIRATGYHDHNWGEWIPTDATWNWAQFSSPRLSLEVGDFIGKPVGVVALDVDGVRTVFTPDQYNLVHTRWAWDRVNRLFYPTESVLTADNGALRLQVTLRALATEPLRGDLPLPLKDLIIYEQTARYDGQVWEWVPAAGDPAAAGDGVGSMAGSADDATTAGEWRVRASLRGIGFKEYTGKHY